MEKLLEGLINYLENTPKEVLDIEIIKPKNRNGKVH